MNKSEKSTAISLLAITAIILITLICISLTTNYQVYDESSSRIYECDYKSLNLNTEITTILNGEEITIKGKIFTFATDPLTAFNNNEEQIGYAGDVYGFISQDDHGIYIDDKFIINMCGDISWMGESYQLKDENQNVIATCQFDIMSINGKITDTDGNIIATYHSPFGRNDYTVTISDNEVCSDLAILMIVASYVSDYQADNN